MGRRPTDETSRRAGPRTALRTPSPRDNLSDPPGAGPRAPASFHTFCRRRDGGRRATTFLHLSSHRAAAGERRKAAGSKKRFPPPFRVSVPDGPSPCRCWRTCRPAESCRREVPPRVRRFRRGGAAEVKPKERRDLGSARRRVEAKPSRRKRRPTASRQRFPRFLGPSRRSQAPGGPTGQRSRCGESVVRRLRATAFKGNGQTALVGPNSQGVVVKTPKLDRGVSGGSGRIRACAPAHLAPASQNPWSAGSNAQASVRAGGNASVQSTLFDQEGPRIRSNRGRLTTRGFRRLRRPTASGVGEEPPLLITSMCCSPPFSRCAGASAVRLSA